MDSQNVVEALFVCNNFTAMAAFVSLGFTFLKYDKMQILFQYIWKHFKSIAVKSQAINMPAEHLKATKQLCRLRAAVFIDVDDSDSLRELGKTWGDRE